MGLVGWIYYLIVGLILFLSLQFLQKKYSISKLDKFVFSNLLLVLITGISFHFLIPYTSDIFLSFAFLMMIDIIYQGYFLGRDFFDKEEKNLSYYFLLILFGFFMNQAFFNRVTEVFLTGEDFRLIIWFLFFLFVYQFIKKEQIFSHREREKVFMSEEGVFVQYAKLKYRYPLHFDQKKLESVLYAIMIYENHNRGKLLRYFDNIKYRMTGNPGKLGIMQVYSKKFITDQESIDLVYKKLQKSYEKNKSKKDMKDLITSYSKTGASDIIYLYNIIDKI